MSSEIDIHNENKSNLEEWEEGENI